jgi:hypothetical protein
MEETLNGGIGIVGGCLLVIMMGLGTMVILIGEEDKLRGVGNKE